MAYNNKRRSTSGSLFGGGSAENIGIGGRKTPFSGGIGDSGGYRDVPSMHAGPEEYGAQQAPPGTWSFGQYALSNIVGENPNFESQWNTGDPWANMGDIYDDYNMYNMYTQQDFGGGIGNDPMTGQPWDTDFLSQWYGGWNWWEQYGPGGYNLGTQSPGGGYTGYGSPSNIAGQVGQGGQQGGYGDWGQGSIFDTDFSNPFGEGWGPEGQIIGGEEEEGTGGPWDVDPGTELDDECMELWNQYNSMGGASMEYSEFSSMFCG